MYDLDTITAFTTFSVVINSKCYGQTLTASSITASSYLVAAAALTKSLTSFTVSSGACTAVAYTLTTSAGAAIDSTVFTFSTSPLQVVISTSSSAKIGTYTFLLSGALTGDS